MSRIDWAEAEVKYVTKPEASYDWLAQLFGVAKSTVVRRAVKRNWPEKRERYTERRIDELEQRILKSRVDIEERQLKALGNAIALFNNQSVTLLRKQILNEEITRKEWRSMFDMTHSATKAIMTERVILGLPTKQVRITDAEAIENVRQMTGSAEPEPIYQKYQETKRMLESLDIDAIIKHKKILESYVKKVEKNGDYTIEHPLW